MGTRYDPGSIRKLIGGMASRLTAGGRKIDNIAEALQRISRLGMSPRQMMLNRLWAWYRTEQYAARKIDWNGREVQDPIEHEAIAHSAVIPPGFVSFGDEFPLKFRKPTAPYALVKVIVERFTGLLFSERHHPSIEVEGDPVTEDYVGALVEAGRLWPQMIQARNYGGAMGTVAMGFQFVDGALEIEVHDPRWCIPTFTDRSKLKLKSIEKRYMYPIDEIDPATDQYVTVWYWYRRVIDDMQDVMFAPVEVADGLEPVWQEDRIVAHGLGFCPVVWVQNLPVQDDMDGDPDCMGIYELVDTIDTLLSQANKGTVANCDPTVVITTDAEMSSVRKGSDNAVKLPSGGTAGYMEMVGSGPKSATELADKYRSLALEVAQVVLDHPDVTNRTATEVERVYSSMITKADTLREQYGEKCIKPLMEMVLAAVRKQTKGTTDAETGVQIVGKIQLPLKKITEEDGTVSMVERVLEEPLGVMQVTWPPYFEPMLTDVEMATRSAIAAKTGRLIDQEHAVKFVASYFKVEDVPAMITQIDQEQEEERDKLAEQALGMLRSPGIPTPGGE